MGTLAAQALASKSIIAKIAKVSESVGSGRFVAVYFADGSDEIVVSTMQKGHQTKGVDLGMGSEPMTRKQVVEKLELAVDYGY